MKILSIGEILLEFIDQGGGHFNQKYAGDTFNAAYYMHKLSSGNIEVEYLTALGDDKFSIDCLEYIESKGIGTSKSILLAEKSMGMFILSSFENGEKNFFYWRGQAAVKDLFSKEQQMNGYDLIYFTGISGAVINNKINLISSLIAAKKTGAKMAYDFNHRQKLWSTDEAKSFANLVLPICDFVKISDEELNWLYPNTTVQGLSNEYNISEWVLTVGSGKCETWVNGQLIYRHEFEVNEEPKDTSAAGDSFNAAYLVSRLDGGRIEDALRYGHKIASQVVAQKGAIVDLCF